MITVAHISSWDVTGRRQAVGKVLEVHGDDEKTDFKECDLGQDCLLSSEKVHKENDKLRAGNTQIDGLLDSFLL